MFQDADLGQLEVGHQVVVLVPGHGEAELALENAHFIKVDVDERFFPAWTARVWPSVHRPGWLRQ
jgi:hypothetical protein